MAAVRRLRDATMLAPSGHKHSLPVCSEAHRPAGWARKQARVRRRCCGAGGAGGCGREEGGSVSCSTRLPYFGPLVGGGGGAGRPGGGRAGGASCGGDGSAPAWLSPLHHRQGDISHTLTLSNSVARRFSHLETTQRRSHNRQLSKDFTKTVSATRLNYIARSGDILCLLHSPVSGPDNPGLWAEHV